MSKHLAKILSICALVVLLPFIIVGSALTFTEAVGVTLSIAEAGNDGTIGETSSKIAIFVDGKEQEENKITIKKNSEVTVAFTGTGYYFAGWYQGNEEEIDLAKDKAVSSKRSFEYTVKGNTVLTAVRDVQTYNISYTGKLADGSTDVAIDKETAVEYGDTLPVLTGTSSKIFAGWKIKDSNDAPSMKANFSVSAQAAEITVEPVWIQDASYKVYKSVADKSNSVNITYNPSTGFAAYTETREGYNFKGLTVGNSGKVYAYDSAAQVKDYVCDGEKLSVVLAGTPAAEVFAVWECKYPTLSYTMYGMTGTKLDATQIKASKDGGAIDWMESSSYNTITFQDSADENVNIDLEDNIYNFFVDGYTNFQKADGTALTFAKMAVLDVVVPGQFMNEESDQLFNIEISGSELEDFTFANILTFVAANLAGEGFDIVENKAAIEELISSQPITVDVNFFFA